MDVAVSARPSFQSSRTRAFPRYAVRVAVVLFGLGIAFASDMPLQAWAGGHARNLDRSDFAQFLRSGGFLPFWLGLSAALVLEGRRCAGAWSIAALRNGLIIAASTAAAGVTAELVKLIFRRERASLSNQWYHFRPIWDRPFDTGGLSMPSSHTLIAFAGAFAIARIYPAARPVALLFAAGTAMTRLYSGAHFASDVYVSVILAWCIVAGMTTFCGDTRDSLLLRRAESPLSH